MRRTVIAALALAVYLPLSAQAQDREAKIKNAMSAAPASIAEHATIMDWDNTELRAGTNDWTCFPAMPDTPADDPTCVDTQGMKVLDAWLNERTPEVTEPGFIYHLQGWASASMTDPLATEPAPGEQWTVGHSLLVILTPHLDALESLPTDPMSGGPWVMYKGTPYVHIMVPVGN